MHTIYPIRLLAASDKNSWLELWKSYLAFYKHEFNQEIADHSFQKLLNNNKDIGCYVACNNDIPVGFITYIPHFTTWLNNDVCYINDLYVRPDYRKMGIAKQLISHITELGKQKGWSRIYWLTKKDNTIARSLYDKIAKGAEWVKYYINL